MLARLISPEGFGYAAVTAAVFELASLIASQLVTVPIVTSREISRASLRSILAVSLSAGFILTTTTALLGYLMGGTLGTVMVACSPLFVIQALLAPSEGIVQRSLDFGRLGINQLAGQTTGATVAILLAWRLHWGALALAVGLVVGALVSALLVVRLSPVGWPSRRITTVRNLITTGKWNTLAGLSYFGFRNVDYLLVGVVLGPQSLGYYYRGYQVSVENPSRITNVMLTVAVPAYSQGSDSESNRLRHRIVSLHACVLFPALALLIVTAPLLIPLVYGRVWEPSVPFAQLLALAGFGSVITSGSGALLLTKGFSRALGFYNLISLVCFSLMVLGATQFGVQAVCLAVVAYQAGNVACNQRFLMGRLMGIRWRETTDDVGPAFAATAALLLVGGAVTRIGLASEALELCLIIFAGAATYLLTLKFLFRETWCEAKSNLGRITSRKVVT